MRIIIEARAVLTVDPDEEQDVKEPEEIAETVRKMFMDEEDGRTEVEVNVHLEEDEE